MLKQMPPRLEKTAREGLKERRLVAEPQGNRTDDETDAPTFGLLRHVATDFEQGKSVARLTVEGQSYNFKTDRKESESFSRHPA